ncbi:hypothetical protein A33Q_0878 [Indibacter alkaliphilus LW1]|uniref:CRISPR-associated protein Cas5 n=1 Tax=Indibacter alkaliphilus (strain CCUG 57479 / KCTC 22604 / LW1) TaxID=1189612 RepID=S2DNV3_INDAL|nr:hypothetical protein [Indibacter alkaliphilus]EOZ98895.1 hypothetical protein A33Q_0878 [Indibacter alkaliphilus LW1]
MTYYVIKYSGPFGFIKPWTAVRDELTYSQTFLSPSTVKGISQKLFGLGEVNRIKRYRLQFDVISEQQEQTWAPLRKVSKKAGVKSLNNGILTRGVLLNPELFLAFTSLEDAENAIEQHLCLCRNEDVLLPNYEFGVEEILENDFNNLPGFELLPSDDPNDIPAGRDRYEEGAPMTYGQLYIKEPAS